MYNFCTFKNKNLNICLLTTMCIRCKMSPSLSFLIPQQQICKSFCQVIRSAQDTILKRKKTLSKYIYLENCSRNEIVIGILHTARKGLNQINIKQFILLPKVVFLKSNFPAFLEMSVKLYSHQVQHA